jgi:hypothetical protein
MSKFIKYDEFLTGELPRADGKSSRHDFAHHELSARPEFTGNMYTTLASGFSGSQLFDGYNFDSVTNIMLSCTDNNPLFTSASGLTSVSAFNFDTMSGLSAAYPEVSGYVITETHPLSAERDRLAFVTSPSGTYALNSYNTMSVTFPTVTATGTVDVIAINSAGYGIFSTDVGTTGITIN